MATLPLDEPWHIRLKDGGAFVHGTQTEELANADAKRRNAEAEKIGVKARYVVVAKP